MKKRFYQFGILSLLCFSFYLTHELAFFMKKSDPIYQSILAMKQDYEIDSFDAQIVDDYIIPGVNGEMIDLDQSYQNMHKNGAFYKNKLVYAVKEPSISMQDNKDKIIFRGNPQKKGVTLLIDSEEFSTYFDELGINYAILTTKQNDSFHYQYGEKVLSDSKNYAEVEKWLKKEGEDIGYCYVKAIGKEQCIKSNKYLFLESKRISKSNFASQYSLISSGDILFIDSSIGISYLKVLLHQIEFRGYRILPLTKLLSEERI